MANFSALKTAIQNAIRTNGNNEITGHLLQNILLSMVVALGDDAISDVASDLSTEKTQRQNADIALQGLINGVKNNIDNGYVYAGIATPSTTPVTGKVFYLALTAGTYTNFDSTEVSQGINILKYNGSAWSLEAFIGIDDTPTPNSPKLVKSGGAFDIVMTNGSAFDISEHFASGGTLATYADLSAALTALNTLSASYKRGGMSIKFVQSSDNKYVQYRLMADTFNTTVANWQGVDDEPTAGSDNLVKSGGVAEKIANDFKHILFRIGNMTDTSVLNRAHSLNPQKMNKGDAVVIPNLNLSKYNIQIIFRNIEDTETLSYNSWLTDDWKKWHTAWNGLLRISVKKVDGSNFTKADIKELNDYKIAVVPKEVEMAEFVADITDTFEHGRDYADIDALDLFDVRVRTGLFAYKCKKGDSISFGKLRQMGYDNISLIAYDDDLTRNPLQSNSENYTFDTSAYIRLSIGPKSGSSSITSTDIENFKNNIKVSRKNTNTYNDSSTYQHLEIVYGCNLDWTTGETVKNVATRALTQTVLVNRGDRIEIDTLNPSSGAGLTFVRVAMYDKNNAYLGSKPVDKKYYLHEDESCYIRLSLTNDDATFVIGEADGKIRLVRNTYNFSNYYLKASMFEIGTISGSTGADEDYNYRARTVPFIFTDKPISVILKNWQDYYFSVIIYSENKSFIRTTTWNYVPTVGDIELTSPYVVPIVATVSPNNGEYYFRVLLKKRVDAAFTESDIAALDDVIEVKTMDCSYTLPSYYNTEIQSVVNRINEKYTPNCFNVITLTDSHDDLGSQYKEISEYLLNQLKAAVELSKKTNSLFIVHCGDITTGSTGKENILHLSQQILDITSEAKCPVFFVRGNHDDATDVDPKNQRTAASALFGKEFLAKISSAGLGELHTIGSLDNNTAYYYDFLKQKVRVIVIDDMVSYPIQESGGYLVYTGGQGNWRGINDNQIQWLLNDALIIPEDYRIIFVEHDVTHSKLSGSHYGTSHNFDYYNAIKAAFNGKLSSVILAGSKPSDERGELLPQYNENDEEITYPSWVTAINFSNRVGGNIIAEISGHHHSDTFWKDESGIIQDNVGTCSPYMQWTHWEPEFGLEEGVSSWETDREPQTIKEALMDVLLISPTKTNRIRFGAKAVSDTKINEYNM